MNNAPLTLRQLAALAGVSRTTVSLALRNHPSISLETRSRVQQLANEHGYALDPLCSQLMNRFRIRRSERPPEKIAFLTFWDKRDEWLAKSFSDRKYFQGASERAAKLGYEIEAFWAKEPGMTGQRMSKILHTRSIRGIIIPPLPRPHAHLSLEWQHFSSVSLSHNLFKPDLHRVAHFHFQGMQLALRSAAHRGYRRIGYANLSGQDARSNHGWLAGYLVSQHDRDPRHHIPPFLTAVWKTAKFASWIKNNRLDAVVTNWPLILDAAQHSGYEVGTELGIISLDVQREEGKTEFAGIDQQPQMQGSTAVDIVVADLQRHEFGLPAHPRIIHLGGVWTDGSTILRRKEPGGVGISKNNQGPQASSGRSATSSRGVTNT